MRESVITRELAEEFRRHLRLEAMLAESTTERYARTIQEFAEFLVQEQDSPRNVVPIDHLLLGRFLRCRSGPEGQPSRAAWNNRLAGLRAFYKWLDRRGQLTQNPTAKLNRQRIHSRQRLPLSVDEFLALIEAMERGPQFYRARNIAIAEVLLHCALRVSSVVHLDLPQVDLGNYLLHDVLVKGGKRISVPFNDRVRAALQAWLSERHRFRPIDSDALFLSDRRRRLSARAVQELIANYARKAQIARPVSPHVLRHSSATELAKFAPLSTVQQHCGHESVATTQRYVHTGYDAWRRAVHDLGAAVSERARTRNQARPSDDKP